MPLDCEGDITASTSLRRAHPIVGECKAFAASKPADPGKFGVHAFLSAFSEAYTWLGPKGADIQFVGFGRPLDIDAPDQAITF